MTEHEIITKPETNRTYHAHGDLGALAVSAKTSVDRFEELWAQEREAIMGLPTHEDGVDMGRVAAYRESIGIPPVPVRMLESTNYAAARRIAHPDDNVLDNEGQYLFRQNVIIVERNPELEALNGPELAESLAVHEAAHSGMSAAFDIEVNEQKRFGRKAKREAVESDSRAGFMVWMPGGGMKGHALEEGYAELERGIYVSEVLGKPRGFTGGFDPDTPSLADKYSYYVRGEQGKKIIMPNEGAPTAVLLETLIEHDPAILTALRNRGTVEGYREVVRRLNDISPTLYREIRALDMRAKEGSREFIELFTKVQTILEQKDAATE